MTWWDEQKKQVFETELTTKSLFVVDEPSDEDLFGFGYYINTLEAVTRECKTPFVVGVLGKWGVGKTTLINKFLKERLAETKEIGFVYFDAWKYQKNAFYRQFLRKMKEDLGISDDTLFIRLYKKIIRHEQSNNVEWNKDEALKLILEFCAWYIAFFIFVAETGWTLPTLGRIATPLLPSLILSLIHRATKLLQVKKYEEEDAPLFSNEEFEDVFKEYVKTALSNDKKRIVIVIDNLDRCTNEVAVELLGTIKTFLNIEGCVYIVPVDEGALINHLKQGFLNGDSGQKDKQSREFLKKFFQATIRLSPFIRGDLEKYIEKISNEVAIPYSTATEKEDVASLVLSAYSHTPRKIKQFYNNLSANYLLAFAQEGEGNIDKQCITGNMPFLGKLIILQEEWPDFFQYIKQDPESLSMAEGWLRGREMESELSEKIKEQLNTNPELKEFLQVSKPFSTKHLEQFINFKREGYSGLEIENSEIATALIAGKSESILQLLTGKNEEAKASIVKLFENTLSNKKAQGKKAAVYNTLTVISSVFNSVPDEQKQKVANSFTEHLANATQTENIKDFSATELLVILSKTSRQDDKNFIIKEHAKPLESDIELFIEYSPAYAEHYKIIPLEARKKLAEALQKAYTNAEVSYVADVFESYSEITKHEGALKVYITPTLIELVIAKIKEIKTEALDELQKQHLALIGELLPILTEPQLTTLFTNIHSVLHETGGWGPGKQELAEFINELVVNNKIPASSTPVVANNYSLYINSDNIAPEYHAKFLPAIKKLSENSAEIKQQFVEALKNIASNLDTGRLSDLFKEIEENKLSFRDKLITPLKERLATTADKTQREQLFELLKMFGALQDGKLYITALKDIVIEAKDFEITNHAISKLEAVRPSLTEKELNEMAPKLLEWEESLVNEPRRNNPFRFITPSFGLLTEENKEKVIDAWSTILEKPGESLDKKQEVSGFIQSSTVLENFPESRKEGFPRKIFDTARTISINEKPLLLSTLVALKPLYSRKSAFIKELKEYGTELNQQPEESQEHKTGTEFLSKLT